MSEPFDREIDDDAVHADGVHVADDVLARLEAHETGRRVSDVLRCAPAGLAGVDLLPAVRRALVAQRPSVVVRSLRVGLVPALCAAAAAIVFVVLGVPQEEDDEVEWRARGSTVTQGEHEAHVRVLRETSPGVFGPLGGTMRASDGLAFVYTNAAQPPFKHLLIFAVASSGDVHWYWPAHIDESDDPAALAIEATAHGEERELFEVVRHALRPGQLTLHVVMSRQPLLVSTVERNVSDLRRIRAGGDDALWQTIAIEVTP